MTIDSIKTSKGFNGFLKSLEHLDKFTIYQQEYENQLISEPITLPYYDCCENPNVIEYRGEYICKNCATVHEPIMTYNFSNNRVNNTLTVENKVNYPYLDHACRTIFSLEKLNPQRRLLFWRLAKLNKFYNNSTEGNMNIANQVLFKLTSQLEIPKSIHAFALKLYKRVVDARLCVGRGIDNLMIGCLYIACRLNHFSCSIDDFARVSLVAAKTLRKNYRLILEHFNIRLKRDSASQIISQFCIKLGLSLKFQNCACQLLKAVMENGVYIGGNLKGTAVAAIYLTLKKVMKEKKINQKSLTELSKVSGVTIRKYIKILSNNINFQNFIAKCNKI